MTGLGQHIATARARGMQAWANEHLGMALGLAMGGAAMMWSARQWRLRH